MAVEIAFGCILPPELLLSDLENQVNTAKFKLNLSLTTNTIRTVCSTVNNFYWEKMEKLKEATTAKERTNGKDENKRSFVLRFSL